MAQLLVVRPLARTMRQSDKLTRFTWLFLLLTIATYSLVSFFFSNIVDVLTPFIAPFLGWPILGLALVAFVLAVVLPFRRWKTKGKATLLPLVILIISLVAAHFIDFEQLWLIANFKFRYKEREEVVKRIADGEFRPNVSFDASVITLPGQLSGVSLGGGQVLVQHDGDKLKIFFFTYRGILDNFAGFIYSSDNSAPKSGDFSGDFYLTNKIQDKWYYVEAD